MAVIHAASVATTETSLPAVTVASSMYASTVVRTSLWSIRP